MRIRAIEYPHPVLNEYSNDFPGCSFTTEIIDQNDTTQDIVIKLKSSLEGKGLVEMVEKNLLTGIVRVVCKRTSYRSSYPIEINGISEVSIPKRLVSESVDIQAIVLATEGNTKYHLDEFNKEYFESMGFELRKGDIVASEPGIRIVLDTVLEKDASGVVLIVRDPSIKELKVRFSSDEDDDPELSGYIAVILPEAESASYSRLTQKKNFKFGIKRYIHASLILPAVVEGISRLRREEEMDPDENNVIYAGTIWAESIKAALASKLGITEIASSGKSDYELANAILGNVVSDSINNLIQKMNEWSTIRQEDELS